MRATLDKLISWTGLLLAVVLLIAGGLLTWASVFIGNEVDAQFSAQDIVMPTEEALAAQAGEGGSLSQEDVDALTEFAGQPLDNGPAAKAYADHYIQAHMNASGVALSGEAVTYEQASAKGRELSAAVAEDPEATEEQQAEAQAWMDLRESLFMGNTLRGLLLYGYAFATIGTIAGYAAFAAFAAAVLLIVLVVLGMRHSRQAALTAA